MDFWIYAIILVCISLIVGYCFYVIGHVHGVEKGENDALGRINLQLDSLIYEYCPNCKTTRQADEILDAEVIQ